MRVFVALLCLVVLGCGAQKPHPCKTPSLLTGDFTVSTQNERLWEFTKYMYDGLGQRMRLTECGVFDNKTFTYDVLLLFRKGVMYEINKKNKTCNKKPFNGTFVPWQVPPNSTFIGQAVLGTSSQPGAGLLVNSWYGKQVKPPVQYISTVTEFACIPVSSTVHYDKFGWVVVAFFNNIIGITDPQRLNPPPFCKNSKMDMKAEPVDFLSLFTRKH